MEDLNDISSMIADYMEKGFLENIIDMFKHDKTLFSYLGGLITDERGRVRLGITALVEDLKTDYYTDITPLIPDIADGLTHPNPTVRADAAYLLGIIAHSDAMPYLKTAVEDETVLPVKEIILESIEELRQ